jgi:hypothetical protein
MMTSIERNIAARAANTRDLGDASESKRLDVLLLDYEMAREDERSMISAITTTYGALVALLALLGAMITGGKKISEPLLAAAPLLPLAVLAYVQMLGIQATVRSYYMRGLERELQKYVGAPIASLGQLPPASYVGVIIELISLRRGKIGYRLVANSILLIITTVFGGLTLYIGVRMIKLGSLQIIMALVYIPAAILLVWESANGTLGGRRLFERIGRSYLDHHVGLPQIQPSAGGPSATEGISKSEERNLVSYLMFPRPEDLVKWLLAPAVYAVTALSTGTWADWGRFVAVWLILEYLIYLARYQWNDIRGIREDTDHAEKRSRGRLPLGLDPQKNVLVSVIVAALRLVAAITVGFVIGSGILILTLVVAVLGIAIVYEFLRSRKTTSHGTPARTPPAAVAIWIVVSLGYAVRASIGFSYGGLSLTSPTALVGMASIASYGSLFVLLTWVLEATSYCRRDPGELKSPRDDGARKAQWRHLDGLVERPHLWALLRLVPIRTSPASEDNGDYCGNDPILKERGQIVTPWNIALLISVSVGTVFGLLLTHVSSPLACTIAVLCCVVGTVVIVLSRRTLSRSLGAIPIAISIAVIARLAHAHPFAVAAIPWTAFTITYIGFRNSSYHDLKKMSLAMKGVGPGIKKCFAYLGKIPGILFVLILGTATRNYLWGERVGQPVAARSAEAPAEPNVSP